jgi:hypothetical protein
VLVSPSRVGSAGSEAVDLAESAGLILDEWQRLVLEEACGEDVNGRWAAFEVGLVVPRQNGKGSVLEARALAGLFLFGERLIIWSAHEFKTAKEAYLRVRRLIEETPHLDALVHRYYQSNETTEIVLTSGARLKFLARNNTSGRGFTGDCVILDEAFALTPDTMAAILPTMAAKSVTGNPQLWYTSSAGMRSSVQLRAVRKRALSDEPGALCWLEWSAPVEARDSPEDRRWWRQANPALGHRISEEFVASEFATMFDDGLEQFCRERLGVFDADEVVDAVFGPGQWAAVASDDVFAGGLTFAVAVNPERTHAAIACADRSGLCELGEYRPMGPWVLDRAVELAEKHAASVAVQDSGPAGSLVSDLKARGVRVELISHSDLRAACGWMYDGVASGQVRVRAHPQLDAAVRATVKKPSGDGFVWDQRAGDVSAFVALTLAAYLAQAAPPPTAPMAAWA